MYYTDSVPAPVYAGVDAGTLQFAANGEIIAEVKLKTCTDVRRKGWKDYLEVILKTWIGMVRET
jgi:hypothetical protein